ncbi:MAG TPA: DUF2917 domain-containing protein [Burkholderiaceae bacterium]|nr:DUF2917 domain-containing protein [Burkholderiaceae bacterium]
MLSIRRFAHRSFAWLFASFHPSGLPARGADTAPGPVSLERGQWLSMDHGGGKVVTCTHGHVWVTQAGDPRDVLIAEGESFACDLDTLTFVQAINKDAEVVVRDRR